MFSVNFISKIIAYFWAIYVKKNDLNVNALCGAGAGAVCGMVAPELLLVSLYILFHKQPRTYE